jgi:two-component sensor histidine kinase
MTLTSLGQGVSKEEAYMLLGTLQESTPDADRMDIYFKAAQYYIYKSGEYAVDIDSARVYMRYAADLNTKIKSKEANAFQVLLKSLLARETQGKKEGKELAERAVNELKDGKNRYYSATAYFCLSEYYSYDIPTEAAERRRLVELAVQSFQQSGSLEQEAYCLMLLADLYALNDEREKALDKLNRCLEIYKSIHYTALQGVYILYSNIYYTDGNYKQAYNYGLMALKNAQAGGDSSMTLCQINNYIGITLVRLKERERAIGYYQAALKVAERHNENNAVLQVMANIVQAYIELKKPEEALAFMRTFPKKLLEPKSEESHIYRPLSYLIIYNELKEYSEIRTYSHEILQLIKLHRPSDKVLQNFYSILIGFYLESRQFVSANLYINKIDSLSRKIGDPQRISETFYLKFRLDTSQGRYSSAVDNLLIYQKMNDSLFNETSTRQIKQLEVEYETEKNRNDIKLKDQNITVLHQKNQLQQSNLERANQTKNFTIGGVAFLFILMGMLYRQYRLKQHANKITIQKNEQLQHFLTEKEWLVKEIHHRVKNNFHVVASLLEIQSSYLKNQEALSAIKESQHRIHSMSIIHQKLYQSETLSTIHMPEYIYELVEYLRESYAIRESIRFDLHIENIELNHTFAITLGLILNEGISNAIKYAFSPTKDGKISISLNHISNSQILLSISDNGPGLPKDYKTRLGASMGLELLQGLTDDIGGSLSIENNNGTQIKIIFSHNAVTTGKVSFHS